MTLSIVWFVVVAFFWTGFFVLEGFDFGVGALHKIVGRTDVERRVAINTIGPVWDGNEVWLIVAGAAMFAAFPPWYATWFSALYLALWLLLAALIVRGVSFEFRGKFDSPTWRSTWSWTLTIGSVLAPLLIGVGLGDLLVGLPIDADGDFTGTFLDLLTPYGLWVGITLLALCLWHGATFLTIRSTGIVLQRAVSLRARLSLPAALLVIIFAVWTYLMVRPGAGGTIALAVPVLAVLAAVALARSARRDGPRVRRDGGRHRRHRRRDLREPVPGGDDLHHRRRLHAHRREQHGQFVFLDGDDVVAAVMVPLVLAYQGWTY